MNISILCPLYNAEKYIKKLNNSIIRQKLEWNFEIKYILTESADNTENILREIDANYVKVKKEEFSHSLTREKEIYNAFGDIVVLITQDIIIKDEKWLYNLVKDIIYGNCEAAFSRQICDNNSIERYTRMRNYPNQSRIASKDNLDKLGIMAYFYSDASSAIRKDIFIKLNGYDNKNLITNEDMYIAYKLIKNGYRIKYCADSEVIHSHNYTYSTLFKRYFDQGVFLKQNHNIKNEGSNSSALDLLKFVVINSIKEKNFKVLFSIIPNFTVRYIANIFGANYKKISKKKLIKYSSNTMYWNRS